MLKRIFSLALAGVLVLGMFSGCGKTTVTDLSQEPTKESTAKGRYVEQEMPLPEGGYALDMVQLNDGRIRVATTVTDLSQEPTKESTAKGRYVEQEMPLPEGGYALDMVQLNDGRIRVAVQKDEATVLLHTTNTDGTEWEDSQTLPEEIGQSGIINTNLALSPDGSVFCATYQENPEDKTYTHHLWMVDPEGTARELSLDGITVDPPPVDGRPGRHGPGAVPGRHYRRPG